jgi:hypothetical protein
MTDDIDLHEFTYFVIPEGDAHPGALFEELIELDEHKHFADEEIAVEFLLRVAPKLKAGHQVLGQCIIPTVQGELKDLFTQLLAGWFGRCPQFLIVLDQEFWLEADDVTRRALLEHELCHVKQSLDKNGDPAFDQDGNPKFGIVGHDLEEFHYIVRKYGAWKGDIAQFLEAAEQHKQHN